MVADLRDAEKTISRELAKPEPNALEVANATSRMREALGWLGKKIDLVADSFAKGFGKALGVAAASAVVGGIAVATGALPPLIQTIGEIIHHLMLWLSYVMSLF